MFGKAFRIFAVLVVLHLCHCGIPPPPTTYIVNRANINHTSVSFSFLLFFYLFIHSGIQKSALICSFYSFLCCFLLSILLILLFYTLLPVPCSVFSLCLFTLFFDPLYCFIFKSAILSFLFYYYYILSASPFCTISIQSVLFLLFFIF